MRVLFVCMGNICRSPTAEAVFADLVRREAPEAGIEADSAGTHDYHIGAPPDARSIAAARRRGIDMSALRARQLEPGDFERFDLLLAMDERNRRDMLARVPRAPLADSPASLARPPAAQVHLLLDYAPELGVREVPDPYYGEPRDFEQVLDLVETAARGLLRALHAVR
ncbi:MAG: low molecular weight phosphotyrosine protein phosphatase [Gammaproteobacteria bacterium]|nr:low molecular weight phosphotyrosine protein phosphatase [Gammaproteobacteria bacterium]